MGPLGRAREGFQVRLVRRSMGETRFLGFCPASQNIVKGDKP